MPSLCTRGQPANTILEIFVISNQGLFNYYYYKFTVQIIPVDEDSQNDIGVIWVCDLVGAFVVCM